MSIQLGLDLSRASMRDAIDAMIQEWLMQQEIYGVSYDAQVCGMEGLPLADAVEAIVRAWLHAKTGDIGPA